MGTGVYDSVHVQIEIIELLSVRIGACGVDRNDGSVVHLERLVLHNRRDNLRVFGG